MKKLVIDKKQGKSINNLFHPTNTYKMESFDEVIIKGVLSRKNSRFLPILLKEVYGLLKVGGKFSILYSPKEIQMSESEIEKIIWWLFKNDCSLSSTKIARGKMHAEFIKRKSILHKEDRMDCWTFGMVTNGVRKDFIERSINSIRKLKIPNYEIIICGHYEGEKGKDIKYIPFTDHDDKGWITRKKNIIAENASYQNLAIFHDRIVFNKDWYAGMKKFGNYFEVLTCRQTFENGRRAGDWLTTNVGYKDKGFMYRIEELDYRDWNRATYIAGQLIIMKRHVWEKVPWNETIYWREAEDIEYSDRLTEAGFIPRFNPYSSCITLSWRFGKLPSKPFLDKDSTLSHFFSDVPIRRIARSSMYYIRKVPFVQRLISTTYPFVEKLSIYKYIREH